MLIQLVKYFLSVPMALSFRFCRLRPSPALAIQFYHTLYTILYTRVPLFIESWNTRCRHVGPLPTCIPFGAFPRGKKEKKGFPLERFPKERKGKERKGGREETKKSALAWRGGGVVSYANHACHKDGVGAGGN